MRLSLLLPALAVALAAAPSSAQDAPRATEAEVFGWMGRIPLECGLEGRRACVQADGSPRLGNFRGGHDARAIAKAIAKYAPTREWAALATVYAAYESSNDTRIVGDGGKALGAWQIQGSDKEQALNPYSAIRVWLGMARTSERSCKDNEPEERLAALASGDCTKGRLKVRRRLEAARSLLGEVQPR